MFGVLDNIIVVGKSFDKHLCNLQAVLERVRQAGLKLHPQKCQLIRHKVTYLGHVVSAQGITPDPDKTDRVNHCLTPQSAKEVNSF